MSDNIRQSYVQMSATQDGFHSQRNQTSQSIGDLQLGSQQKETGLEFHIKYPIQSLIMHFRTIFNSKGYKATEIFPGKVMLVKLGFMDRVKYLLSRKQPSRYILTINTNQYRSVRKVLITPSNHVVGSERSVTKMLHWIESQPPSMPIQEKTNSEIESQCQQDMYSLESIAIFMYHKILVEEKYSLGTKMQKLVNSVPDTEIHHQGKETAQLIIGGIKQITEDMLKGFNCTRKQLLEILCHCRKAVEDYYHDRKFNLRQKEDLELERGSIEIELGETVPMTIKCFEKLRGEFNSHEILRQFFYLNTVFAFECEMRSKSEAEKKSLATKTGQIFHKVMDQKIRILDLWGYSGQCYDEFIGIFTCGFDHK